MTPKRSTTTPQANVPAPAGCRRHERSDWLDPLLGVAALTDLRAKHREAARVRACLATRSAPPDLSQSNRPALPLRKRRSGMPSRALRAATTPLRPGGGRTRVGAQ